MNLFYVSNQFQAVNRNRQESNTANRLNYEDRTIDFV